MKRVLPKQAKIAKVAQEAMQEGASEFIAFVASEAAERCMDDNRRTIRPEDLLESLQGLGFEQLIPSLEAFLDRYRSAQKKKVAGRQTAAAVPAPPAGGSMVPPPAL